MMIILIIQHPYGANDRARDEDINKPAGSRLAELKLELHDPEPNQYLLPIQLMRLLSKST